VRTHLKRTSLICIICGFVLIGLFLAKLTEPLSVSWLILCSILLAGLRKIKGINIIVFICLALVLGWWRGGVLQAQNIKYQDYYGDKITLRGTATEDGFYSDKSQLEFTVSDVSINNNALPGKVRIRGFGAPAVYRYDQIEAVGKLYPSRGGRQASMSFADIDVTGTTNGLVDKFRRNFIAGMENALPEPAASLGIGLLVGQRSLMPDDVLAILVTVGLVHIIAVSGYNLTIIVDFSRRLTAKMSRFQVVFIACMLMYFFILVTGFSPSIVRAAMVSVLSLLAWYFGRKFMPLLLILLVAAITAFFNPYYVWGDIGWYLSFLAFFGILILAPQIVKMFKKDKLPLLIAIAIESLSATIMTAPLIMSIFGRVSLVSLVANIIVVPLVPFAMLFSLIAGLAGMIVPTISGWLALPARILLNIILTVSEKLSKIPHAQLNMNLSIAGMLAMYAVVIIVIFALRRRNQSVTIVAENNIEV